MTSASDLRQAVRAFEAMLVRSASEPRENRRAMVDYRRQTAEHVATIASLAAQLFENEPGDGHFRSEISKARHALALHQASWPVVAIDFADPEYIKSVSAMRTALQAFIAWAKEELQIASSPQLPQTPPKYR